MYPRGTTSARGRPSTTESLFYPWHPCNPWSQIQIAASGCPPCFLCSLRSLWLQIQSPARRDSESRPGSSSLRLCVKTNPSPPSFLRVLHALRGNQFPGCGQRLPRVLCTTIRQLLVFLQVLPFKIHITNCCKRIYEAKVPGRISEPFRKFRGRNSFLAHGLHR